SPDEARQAVLLLATGEFLHDIAIATAAIFSTVPHVPLDLARDIPRTPFHLFQLARAVALDLGGAGLHAPALAGDILDG
ncbi:hypothetical protein NL533_35675, partial [Klebsiella pneumoniae]|nr:hypothetical protein [Klebsiella pneumoniae]